MDKFVTKGAATTSKPTKKTKKVESDDDEDDVGLL
jgi:hypothetical protein